MDTRSRHVVLAALTMIGVLAGELGAPASGGAQMGTWVITDPVRAKACARGICRGQWVICDGCATTIEPDGTYHAPTTGGACPGLPDEVGTWQPLRKPRRFLLEPTNLGEMLDELAACLGLSSLELRDYSHRIKVRRDGQSIRGRTKTKVRVRVGGRTIGAAVIVKYTAVLVPGVDVFARRAESRQGLAVAVAAALAASAER